MKNEKNDDISFSLSETISALSERRGIDKGPGRCLGRGKKMREKGERKERF